MSLIPDCRTDENYNEDFLNETDSEFVKGFDWAIEQMKNLFEGNLDVYEEELNYVPDEGEAEEDEVYSKREDLFEIVSDNAGFLANMIDDWMEMERDELITSIIDHMDEDEYEKLKAAAIKKNDALPDNEVTKKKYVDSRKLYNIIHN